MIIKDSASPALVLRPGVVENGVKNDREAGGARSPAARPSRPLCGVFGAAQQAARGHGTIRGIRRIVRPWSWRRPPPLPLCKAKAPVSPRKGALALRMRSVYRTLGPHCAEPSIVYAFARDTNFVP